MKRKLVKLGRSTLVMSLPMNWVTRFNLNSSSQVEVEERDQELVVSTKKINPLRRISLNLKGLDSKSFERFLISAYLDGIDEIKLNYSGPFLIDLKKNEDKNIFLIIEKLISSQFIGMELVERTKDYLIIKNVSSLSEETFEVVLRRIFLLIKELVANSSECIKSNSFDLNESFSKNSILRLINYSKRILNKTGSPKNNMGPKYYSLIDGLKLLTDILYFSVNDYFISKNTSSKELSLLLESLKSSFNLFYEIFYSFDQSLFIKFIEYRRVFFKLINKINNSNNFSEILLVSRLSVFIVNLLNMFEIISSFNMEKFIVHE